MEKLGGRKFVYAVATVLLGFVLVLVGKVEPKLWFDFAEVIGGIFVLGNVSGKFLNKPNEGKS